MAATGGATNGAATKSASPRSPATLEGAPGSGGGGGGAASGTPPSVGTGRRNSAPPGMSAPTDIFARRASSAASHRAAGGTTSHPRIRRPASPPAAAAAGAAASSGNHDPEAQLSRRSASRGSQGSEVTQTESLDIEEGGASADPRRAAASALRSSRSRPGRAVAAVGHWNRDREVAMGTGGYLGFTVAATGVRALIPVVGRDLAAYLRTAGLVAGQTVIGGVVYGYIHQDFQKRFVAELCACGMKRDVAESVTLWLVRTGHLAALLAMPGALWAKLVPTAVAAVVAPLAAAMIRRHYDQEAIDGLSWREREVLGAVVGILQGSAAILCDLAQMPPSLPPALPPEDIACTAKVAPPTKSTAAILDIECHPRSFEPGSAAGYGGTAHCPADGACVIEIGVEPVPPYGESVDGALLGYSKASGEGRALSPKEAEERAGTVAGWLYEVWRHMTDGRHAHSLVAAALAGVQKPGSEVVASLAVHLPEGSAGDVAKLMTAVTVDVAFTPAGAEYPYAPRKAAAPGVMSAVSGLVGRPLAQGGPAATHATLRALAGPTQQASVPRIHVVPNSGAIPKHPAWPAAPDPAAATELAAKNVVVQVAPEGGQPPQVFVTADALREGDSRVAAAAFGLTSALAGNPRYFAPDGSRLQVGETLADALSAVDPNASVPVPADADLGFTAENAVVHFLQALPGGVALLPRSLPAGAAAGDSTGAAVTRAWGMLDALRAGVRTLTSDGTWLNDLNGYESWFRAQMTAALGGSQAVDEHPAWKALQSLRIIMTGLAPQAAAFPIHGGRDVEAGVQTPRYDGGWTAGPALASAWSWLTGGRSGQ